MVLEKPAPGERAEPRPANFCALATLARLPQLAQFVEGKHLIFQESGPKGRHYRAMLGPVLQRLSSGAVELAMTASNAG